VELRVGDQVNIAKTLLHASGQDEDVPYKITWTTFAAGPPLLEAINAGAVDVGGVGDAPPVFAQSSGAAIKIVAASTGREADQSSEAILVPASSSIKTVADLKGKRVGVTQGSAAHWLVLAALEKAGLGFDDIKPAYLLPSDGLAAFNGGDIDAWAVWDPFVSVAQQQGARIITTGAGLVGGYGFQVARPKALADPKTSAAIGDYLTRLAKAANWATTHKDEWGQLYGDLTKLPAPVVTSTLQRFDTTYVPLGDDIRREQQREADAFHDNGLIPAPIDVGAIFDTRYTDELEGA
jgi:sulfonate transport system substrate-binding protein